MNGFKRIKKKDIPRLLDCSWKRIKCGRPDCFICGQNATVGRSVDSPRIVELVLEDEAPPISRAVLEIARSAKRAGITVENLCSFSDPPGPLEFPLYVKVLNWRELVLEGLGDLVMLDEVGCESDVVLDLLWYTRILCAKSYRQLCNRWHLKVGDGYGEFDYEYTRRVIRQVNLKLRQSLTQLYIFSGSFKPFWQNAYENFNQLCRELSKL